MRVLILGGTSEASALVRAVAGDPRFEPMLSLAGRTRTPAAAPIPVRIGGFGGIAGLVAFLQAGCIDALIDATHPFATRMSNHAAVAAAETAVPLLAICRPPWRPIAGDRWRLVPHAEAAEEALGRAPRRVFLTIGQKDLTPFAAAPWHHYLVRSVDPPDAAALPARAEVIAARGPFHEAAEEMLLRWHRIEVLVTKNSGGTATMAKLTAARTLGLPVIMIDRPPGPAVPSVPDAAAAFDWLARLHHTIAARRGV